MTPNTLEHLSGDVTREYWHENKLVAYTLEDSGKIVTDTWADHLLEEMRGWDRQIPYLCLQDFTQAGTNPYMQDRAAALFERIPTDLHVKFAVITSHSAVGMFWVTFLKTMARQYPLLKMEYQVFSQRDEGLLWLEQFVG